MKIKLSLFIGVLIIGFVSNTWAGKTSETLFTQARAIFERSLGGDDSVTGVALNQFKILSKIYRDNPLFLAYKGASYTLMGRDAFWSWNKTGYTENGLEIIDNALRMLKPEHDHKKIRGVPISVETRLIAVSTFYNVPSSFNQLEKAKAVLNDLLQSPALNNTPSSVHARIRQIAKKIRRY